MALRDQLSLTKNGGVYYEGTRVTPTQDPVLFVGLGGTGVDALLRIKNEVQTRMPLPKDSSGQIIGTSPSNIGFLALDTDKKILTKTYGVAGFDKSGDEFIDITVDGLPQVIGSVVERHLNEEEWKWFDKDLTANGGIDGANGIRQIGRFMLFQNINEVRSRFITAIEKVLNGSSSTNLKIFILTGIGGGTGSGTFLDVAYVIRQVALDKTPNVQLHGYVFTPDLNKGNGGDDSSMYRNGYASLKELDYWMSASEHQNHFIQRYNVNFIVNSNARPFDFCHLITARDCQHNLVNYTEAMDAVGGNLFSYIVSERVSADGNTALSQMYDNISSHINNAVKPYAANYHYLSIGSDKLEIPYTEITTLVAAKVFKKLAPVFDNAPDPDSFKMDLKRLELSPEQLWSYIHKNVVVDPLQGNKFKYGDIWPGRGPQRRAEQWLVHAQQIMRQNSSNLSAVREGMFREYIKELIKNANRGPCYASRLVLSNTSMCLIKTLEGFRNDCAERMSAATTREGALKTKLDQSFVAGSNVGLLGHSNATKEFMEALTAWLGNQYAYWAYFELVNGIDEFIARLKKYYDRIFKNLQDSLCALPDIFEENMNKLIVDEQGLRKNPEKARRYLIRPLEFEVKYKTTLEKKIEETSGAFLDTISNNIKKWVGIELDEVDYDILENTDIGGCIATFINDNFGDTITMNMETLLLDKVVAGTNSDEFLRETLDSLKGESVPMFHMDVEYAKTLSIQSFSIISVPDDCPRIFAIANRPGKPVEDGAKFSAEKSKLQWVKVMSGMPLFAFPEVVKMEQKYETAMKTSRETRRGVHLRWEWREELPSPLPEKTWRDDVRNEPQKEYAKAYNDRIRKAFDACWDANIIRPIVGGDAAMLYIADESVLDKLELFGTVAEKKAKIEMVRATLWSNDATAIKLNPFGNASNSADLKTRVYENNTRFYHIAKQIEKQAEILDRFGQLNAGFENVEHYINSIFANLIFDQGFETRFRRSELDYSPIKLFDKMTQTTTPDFDTYKGFCGIMDESIKENIRNQFDAARRNLLNPDGSFVEGLVAQKVELFKTTKERYAATLSQIQMRIQQTPIDQRGNLLEIADFYTKAIEIIDNNLRIFNA